MTGAKHSNSDMIIYDTPQESRTNTAMRVETSNRITTVSSSYSPLVSGPTASTPSSSTPSSPSSPPMGPSSPPPSSPPPASPPSSPPPSSPPPSGGYGGY